MIVLFKVEILEVICSNYESLTLKIQESLDLYEEWLHQYIYKYNNMKKTEEDLTKHALPQKSSSI